MDDILKKFVDDNRADFEDKMPRLSLWDDIEAQLDAQEEPLRIVPLRARWVRYLQVAAAAVVLLVAGAALGSYFTQQRIGAPVAVSKEYSEAERFYAQEVRLKMETLRQYPSGAEVLKELEELDGSFEGLKQRLQAESNTPEGNERLMFAMLEHYKKKTKILERVLMQLERQERPSKTINHEKINL